MKEKLHHIEILRAFCIILLVVHHTSLGIISSFPDFQGGDGLYVCNMIGRMTRILVPVFVIITGTLLLSKSRDITYEKVLKKYVWRMCVVLMTVGLFYAITEKLFYYRTFNANVFFESVVNVLEGKSWKHLWYVYMLLGLYLILPVIKKFTDSCSLKSIGVFLTILFIFCSIVPCYSYFLKHNIEYAFPIRSIYVLFLVLGFVFSNPKVQQIIYGKAMRIICPIVFVLCYILIFYTSHLEFRNGMRLAVLAENYSPLYIMNAIVHYLLFMLLFSGKFADRGEKLSNNIIIHALSANSFGIYLFHMLWIHVAFVFFHFNPIEHYNVLVFALFCIAILVLSWLTTIIYRKIPLIGKYV